MKITLSLFLFVLLLGCREFNNPYDPANNRPPDLPSEPHPVDGASRQDTVGLVLRWSCIDPDSFAGDELTYDIHFGTETVPPRVETGLAADSWSCGRLSIGTTYYWRVVAHDSRGDTTAGPIWSFSTNPNLPPLMPSEPRPGDGLSNLPTEVMLSWQGGDPNPGDTVVYDIHLGRTSPPPLIARDVDSTRWTVTGLDHDARYYWQVVARDQDSARTEGPIWEFVTMSRVRFSSPSGDDKWRIGELQWIEWSFSTDGIPGPAGKRPVNLRGFGANVSPGIGRSPASVGEAGAFDTRATSVVTVDSTVLFHSADSGLTWQRIHVERVPGRQRYHWPVAGPPSLNAMVKARIHIGRDVERTVSEPFIIYESLEPIVVTAPAEGVRWQVGERQTVRWEGGNGIADSTVVFHSIDDGQSWVRQGRATGPGSFAWTVPGPVSNTARVLVRGYVRRDVVDGQSARFTIHGMTPVAITAPDSTTRWRMYSEQVVRWTGGSDLADSAIVHFRPDGRSSWQRQGSAAADSFVWRVPEVTSDEAQVRVAVWESGNAETGISPGFTIYDTLPPTQPQIVAPAGGVAWEIGSVYEVRWNEGTDGMDSVVVSFSVDDGTNWLRQGVTREPGVFRWMVPGPVSDEARIRVQAWCLGESSSGVSSRFRVVETAYPDSVVATVNVGERPTALCWNRQDNRLYVANRNSGTVSVFDGSSNSVIATVPVGSFPAAIAWDSIHNKVYCANEGDRTVTIIDGADNSVIRTVPVGAAPRHIVTNPVSGKAYIANSGAGANSVTIINAATDSVIATIPTGERPRALAWNPVNNRVYVSCNAGNSVTVIDGVTNQVVGSIPVGNAPSAITVVEDKNHIYVANSDPASNSVTVINAADNSIVRTIPVGNTPTALAWNSIDNKVYVANEAQGSVTIINTGNQEVIRSVSVGVRPFDLRWVARGNMLYVACRASNEVMLISGSSNELRKTLRVGREPVALAWAPEVIRVYVANLADATVSVLGAN